MPTNERSGKHTSMNAAKDVRTTNLQIQHVFGLPSGNAVQVVDPIAKAIELVVSGAHCTNPSSVQPHHVVFSK